MFDSSEWCLYIMSSYISAMYNSHIYIFLKILKHEKIKYYYSRNFAYFYFNLILLSRIYYKEFSRAFFHLQILDIDTNY